MDDLGDFDCVCYPEVMRALMYALNDSDPDVRAQAADEIGDLLRDDHCCCKPEVISALSCALADCDDDVRDQAEEALEACGYQVVDGCCGQGCCTAGCVQGGCVPAQPGSVPATPAPKTVPGPAAPAPMAREVAPVPPQEPKAYYPQRLRQRTTEIQGIRAPINR